MIANMKLDLNALEAFEAIVEHGSVAGAAKALNKAQSAVSYHLRRLEDQLGVVMLDRSGYRLKLTPEGEGILAEARPILEKLRELSRYGARYRSGWEPSLKIFFDGALPTSTIVAALGTLEKHGAPTRIDLRVGFLDGVQAAFSRQGGDVLIAAIVKPQPDIVIRTLAPLDFVLCCSSSHALATITKVARSELQEHTELIISSQMDEPALPAHHFHSRRVFHLSDFHTKLTAVLQGLGYGWLPQYMAEPHLRQGSLHAIAYEAGARFQLMPAVATRSAASAGKAAKLIVDYLEGHGWN